MSQTNERTDEPPQIIDLQEYRAVDPLADLEIKKLISSWYSYSTGGTPCYSFVLLSAIPGRRETDPLYALRFRYTKIMHALQPIAAAWARDERCDIDFICSAATRYPRAVVREWCDMLIEVGAVESQRVPKPSGAPDDCDLVFYPTRALRYRCLEMIQVYKIKWETLQAENARGLDLLNKYKKWAPIESGIPKEKNICTR